MAKDSNGHNIIFESRDVWWLFASHSLSLFYADLGLQKGCFKFLTENTLQYKNFANFYWLEVPT